MRKYYLLTISLLMGVLSYGQNTNEPLKEPADKQKLFKKPGLCVQPSSKDVPFGEVIGFTNYDLQTNDGIVRRIINHGNGTLSTVWTQYQGETMPNAPQRGTGYNYFDGSAWSFTEYSGNIRIEGSTRTGWPALVSLQNGTEFVINHAGGSNGWYGWKQTIGQSNTGWTASHAAAPEDLYWPRAASSGNTIHVFGVVDQDVTYNGQKPAPVYMRSQDGGSTWSAPTQIPGTGSAYYDGIVGDSYSMDANGQVVAILLFEVASDFVLLKSTDGGNTWSKKIIADFPVDNYDWEGGVIIDFDTNGEADIVTCVNNADVVVDNQGVVHVGFSTLLFKDDDATDNKASYYYYAEIGYWNDSAPAGDHTTMPMEDEDFHGLYIRGASQNVGFTPDLNDDGFISNTEDDENDVPKHGEYGWQGWCGFPSIATNYDGDFFISYSTTMEGSEYLKTDAFPEAQNFKHVLISQFVDGQWYLPYDVTSSDAADSENVYCSLAKKVDNKLYMQYQNDGEPGVYMREDPSGSGQQDPVTENAITAKFIPVPFEGAVVNNDVYVGVRNLENLAVSVFPNPATDKISVNVEGLNKIEVYNIMGELVATSTTSVVDIRNLTFGTYIVKAYTQNGVSTSKVVKQ